MIAPPFTRRTAVPALFAALLSAPALALAAAPASSILPPDKDAWIQVQTAHFALYSDASEKRVVDLGQRIERFRAALSRFNKRFRVDPAVTTRIFVFKNDASFTPYKKRFNGKVVDMAGMFVGLQDGNFIVLNGEKQGDPLETIYHEYIHHYLGNNLHNIPVWFNEGLAECYSGFRVDDRKVMIGLTQTEQVLFLREHHLMPLHDLFAIGHDSPDYNEGDRRGIFYAESWAFMHYFLFDKPERKPQFTRFLERLGQGEPPNTAFPAAFETSYEKFEYELKVFVDQARYMLTTYPLSDLGADEGARVTPMTRAQTLARLGDLLAHLDPARFSEAEQLLREAQRIDPDEALSYAGLGYLAQSAGRLDEAVTLYDKAMAFDAKDPLTAFHLGQTLARRAAGAPVPAGERTIPADVVRAEDMFGQTIQQRHEFGEAYIEYARIIMENGLGEKAAVPLLEAARVLLPSRVDVVVNLTALYAYTGQLDRAQEMADNVLTRMSDPEALAQARDQIKRAAEQRSARMVAVAPPQDAGRVVDPPAALTDDNPPDLPPPPPTTTRPGPRTVPKATLQGTPINVYNGQVAVYNQAIETANRGNYRGAIKILEDLRKQVKDGDLRAMIDGILARLKKDAARYQ